MNAMKSQAIFRKKYSIGNCQIHVFVLISNFAIQQQKKKEETTNIYQEYCNSIYGQEINTNIFPILCFESRYFTKNDNTVLIT